MSDNALAKLDAAQHALAECKTVMEAKQIGDIAEASRVYLERTNASAETVNRATEVRLLAERQMGEFLKQMPKNTGERGQFSGGAASEPPATLSEIGITKKQSSTAQKLAAIPEDEFKARIAVAKIEGGKLSTAKVMELPSRTKHTPNRFDFEAWKRDVRLILSTKLNYVPNSNRSEAVQFITTYAERFSPHE